MHWLVLTTIVIVTLSAARILQRLTLSEGDRDPIAFAIAFQVIAGSGVAAVALIRGFSLPLGDLPVLNLAGTVVLYAMLNIFLFKSLARIEASRFSVFYATTVLWTVVTAMIFLGDRPTTTQLFGGLLVLSGVVLISRGGEHRRFRFGKGEVFALAAAAVVGVALTNDGFLIAQGIDVPSYTAFAFLAPAVLLAALRPASARQALALVRSPRALSRTIVFSLLFAVATLSIYSAFVVAPNVSLVAMLIRIQTILTVALGIFFLKERSDLGRKLLAAGISFAGIVLILL